MDFLNSLITILAVIVGASLTEVFGLFNRRRKKTAVVNNVLSDLLELQHSVRVSAAYSKVLDEQSHLDLQEKNFVRVTFDSMRPQLEELSKRYQRNVGQLAAINPSLAFYLRGKDSILPFFSMIREGIMEEMPEDEQNGALELMNKLETKLLEEVKGELSDSIKVVARQVNKKTWKNISKFLEEIDSPESEAEARKRLSAFIECAHIRT